MTDKAKVFARRAVTGLLLAFVAASIVVLVAQEVRRGGATDGGSALAGPGVEGGPDQQVIATYFHRTVRCVTCRTIEEAARRTVEKDFSDAVRDGRLAWRVINLDAPGNEHYATDFALSAASVVLVEMKDGDTGRWKTLGEVWDLYEDETALARYLRAEIGDFLLGGS